MRGTSKSVALPSTATMVGDEVDESVPEPILNVRHVD
jgi:hypothetical protein